MLGEDIEVLEEQPYHFEKARPKPGKTRPCQGCAVGGVRRGTGRGSNMRRYNRGGPTPTTAAAKVGHETATEGGRTVAKTSNPFQQARSKSDRPNRRRVAGHPAQPSSRKATRRSNASTETVQTVKPSSSDGGPRTTGHDVAAQT